MNIYSRHQILYREVGILFSMKFKDKYNLKLTINMKKSLKKLRLNIKNNVKIMIIKNRSLKIEKLCLIKKKNIIFKK